MLLHDYVDAWCAEHTHEHMHVCTHFRVKGAEETTPTLHNDYTVTPTSLTCSLALKEPYPFCPPGSLLLIPILLRLYQHRDCIMDWLRTWVLELWPSILILAPPLIHLLDVWSWITHLTSLCFSFFPCKMRRIVGPPSEGCSEYQMS